VVENVGKQVPVDSKRAIAIARAHLQRLNRHALEGTRAEARRSDAGWDVTVTSLPEVPGGYTIVQINGDGKVLNVIHGE